MTVAVLLDNPFTNDRRVLREVETLAEEGWEVLVYCVKDSRLPLQETPGKYRIIRIFGNDIYDMKKTRRLGRYCPVILENTPAVVHCHDQHMLQLGKMLKKRNPGLILVYDSHELFHAWPLNLSRFNDPFLFLKSWAVRKLQVIREKRNARFADAFITVNAGIAEILFRYFGKRHHPVVLRNTPALQDYTPRPDYFRSLYGLDPDCRILVFIGSAVYMKTLNLEQVIRETDGMAHIALLIIAGEQGGKADLQHWVRSQGYRHVFFHPKLEPEAIGDALASCDVGLVPTWNKKDLSYWYALDNKLFEYIMSGIPVLATAQPEYRAIVETYRVGLCVDPDRPGDYARGLSHILDNYEYYMEPLRHARQDLNWANEKEKLTGLYRQFRTR